MCLHSRQRFIPPPGTDERGIDRHSARKDLPLVLELPAEVHCSLQTQSDTQSASAQKLLSLPYKGQHLSRHRSGVTLSFNSTRCQVRQSSTTLEHLVMDHYKVSTALNHILTVLTPLEILCWLLRYYTINLGSRVQTQDLYTQMGKVPRDHHTILGTER